MASTISFSGLSASGLDTSSWVDALVSVKQQTITSLEQQKAEKENLLSIVNNIKSYFSSFQTCLQKITDSQYGIASMDLFMQNLALSSNSSIATATATTEAARQSYDVAVDSLATATKATSGYSQFEVKTADLNTTFGTLGGKNGTITVNSQSFNVTTEDTLQNLIDKFKNVGVDAKFDESKGTFTIGMDLNKIDEGATNLKNALKLANNNVSGAVSGSVVYANRNTEFYKLGLNGGDINIEGVKHTITKNGNNYTIQKDGGAAVQMNTLGEFLDYLKSSAVGADDATVDAKGHITIKGATLDKVEGGTNLMDVLNLIESQKRTVSESGALSYIEVRVADLNTKLSALGITGDTTLVAGGTNNTISNDKTLGDIKNILKNAGVDMSVDSRGIITIDTHGNEISGTLLDVLNLDPTKGGTTISSSAHQATLKADGNTKLSELGITTDKKYIAYKSDGTALTTEISNVEGKTVNEFVNALKNSGLDAKFDEKTHQITIKDGYIEGSLADALGMTQLSTSFTENASLNTQLEKLGATGDSTLTIDGGAAKTYDKNTTLETVFNDIKNAGGKVTFKDGNVTIEGVTLGGSLPSLLGLDATTQGTSVTSGILTAVTGSTSSGGNTESTVEHNIELSTKLGDITGTTSNYTLKVGDGASTTYTKDSTLQDIKTQIEGAGGKFTINDDNTISIEGVTMSGTVVGALGFDELATGTKFTTVNAVMISGTSNVATGGTTLGNLGLIASGSTSGARAVRRAPANPNKTLSINGGTAKTYGADSSLDDIFADIVAAGGTASINSEGYIVINGVHLEGTLVDALGLVETSYKTTITSGDLKVTTSTKSTSSSALYSDTKGDIAWDSTIGSIVGDTNSYDLKVNGTNKTYNTNTKLSDIKNVIQAAGGTMTINDDNTISINGVEISGSLVDKLGFYSDGVHTVVSSNNPIYYSDGKKSADTGTTFEQLGIGTDKRDYAIYKNDGTVVKASSTNGTSSGKTIGDWLRVVNDSLNTANGTRDITYASINNGVISITGGYVTGSLPTELGIGIKETVTGITMEGSSVSYVEYEPLKYIGNIQTGSGIAGGTMVSSGFMAESIQYQDELGNIHAVTETTKLSEVLDTSGNKIGSGSYTFNVGSYTKTFDADSTTLGDIVNYVNNLNMDTTHDTTTSATLVDGKLTIESNVSITGTLLDKLGFEKQDVSTVAYEIKGTNKAHYSKSEGVTVTASGFSTAVTTQSTSGADKVYVSSLSDFVSGSTYYVKSASDLNKLAELTNAGKDTSGVTFVLENDIDLAGQQFVPIGTYNNRFKGNFYGNGHVIKNLTITDTSVLSDPFTGGSGNVYYAGLFGDTYGAKLYDIGLENVNINLFIDGKDKVYAGALVASSNWPSKLEINNCYSTGSVSTDSYAGGLVGIAISASVSNSYSTVNVNGSIVGGLVASLDGKISNSFATGNVDGTTAGGLVGVVMDSSTISNSFATGNVVSNVYAGGLVGEAFYGNITISDSFAMADVTGVTSQGGIVGIIKSSVTTTVTNCGYSGSTGLASGVTSGATAMTDAQLKSSIEGLGISSATVVNKTVDTTAELTTTIKDLIGKGGEQGFNFCESGNPMAVSRRIAFAETDTIQTVIDKLKEFGFDEVDLVDGVFRIKDDKQWTLNGRSELVNKLFGGDDRTYGAEGPQVTYQVTQSSVGGYTGNKITYTTTTTGTIGSVTGSQLSYTTSGTGTAGSVTGNKVTYETTGTGTAGSVTGDKLTYTTTTGSTGSVTGNKVTYTKSTTTNTGYKYTAADYNSSSVYHGMMKDFRLVSYIDTNTTYNSPQGQMLTGRTITGVDKDGLSFSIVIDDSTTLELFDNQLYGYGFRLTQIDAGMWGISKADKHSSGSIDIGDLAYQGSYNAAEYVAVIGKVVVEESGVPYTSTTQYTADTSTKMSELGITDFTVNGSALSGITSSSTINDVLAKLKSTYGLSEATISDGKITLKSNTDTTLSGNLIKGLMGQDSVTITPIVGGTTSKTYSGSVLKTVSKGYTTDTKLVDIDSSYKGTNMYVYKKNSSTSSTGTTPVRPGTSGKPGKPGNSVDMNENNLKPLYEIVATLSIDSNTTIQDVIDFYNPYLDTKKANIFKPLNKYSLEDGTITLAFKSGYSDKSFGSSDETTLSFGTTTPTVATTSTKLYELETVSLRVASIKVINNGNKYSFDASSDETDSGIDSPTIQDVLDFLNNTAGCTATFIDGKLTVTGASDLEFEKPTTTSSPGEINVNQVYDMSILFGGSMPTPTTSGGSGSTGGSSTQTATGTTKMSELGITDFKVNGSALSGITGDSTVNDVLSKLKSTYGLSEATISDGKITLSSNTDTTLSGNLIKGLMGQDSVTITPTSGTTTTTKTYTGTKVTYGATSATGYTTDTKLSTIRSRWVGQRIYVKSSEYTGSTTGYPGNSILFQYMDITNTTTIDDVINFFDRSAGVMKATYDQTSGELKLRLNVDYSVSAPFIQCVGDDQLIGQLATKVYSFGKTGGSSGSNMTASTTLNDLLVVTAVKNTITITNNGTTTSFDISQETNLLGIISNLQSVGCTASITDGVLTVTGAEDLAFGGNTTVWKKIFGGSIPTPTTSTTGSTGGGSTGGSSTQTATGTTKMSELGITDFKVNGSALSGITSSSTVNDVLAKLKSTYGLSEATISDGKITLKSNSNTTLSGNLIKGLMGQDSVTITPTAGDSSTNTATEDTTFIDLGYSSGSSPEFKVDGKQISITSSMAIKNLLALLEHDYGITGSITDGKITLSSDTQHTLTGEAVNKLFGQDSVTITPDTSTTTQTADTTTKLGASGLGLTSFDLTIDPTGDAEPISISGLNGDSTIGDVFKKLAEKGITASMNNGVITLTSNTPCDLTGTIAKKLFGKDSVSLECADEIHDFTMTQVSGTKYQYVSRDLTSYSGAERVSEVSQLVAGNKYHISSAEDLVALANFVKNGADTTGSIFMFDNDIDMSGVTGFEGIGTLDNAFKGTVYGNGHVVKNMTINTSSSYQGLFGNINQSTIKDLGVVDANVTGDSYIGILVGQAKNSQISNVYTSGTVTSNGTWVGGLVGYLTDSTATNVYSTAGVKGKEGVGGLIGCSDGSIVEKAFATGKVTASGGIAGGLFGGMNNGGTVKNSYATGDVNGDNGVGGFVGLIGANKITITFDTVYSTGRVSGSENVGGFIGCIIPDTTTNIKNAVYNRSTGVDAIGGGSVTGILGKDYEQMIQKSIMQNAGFTEDKGWVYTANTTPTFGNTTVTGGGKTYLDSSITSLSSGSTYYISTLEQLNNLATLVNNGADTSGVNFVLDNDIDVSSFTNTIDCFKGTFYGNGHSLTGLKTALFSIVEGNAIVRDLALENMSESGHLADTVMDNSTVDNVYSTGSTNNNAGLITTLEDNATLKNSYSTANLTVNAAYAGGLVSAMSDNATIEHCFAKNTIEQNASHSKYNYAGGLVGMVNGGTIKSSYADCNVHAYGYAGMTTTAGSLIGKTSGNVTIENCYATGSIGANKKDFFIGQNDGSVTSSGNVACTGSSISGTPSGFSDGVTFVSNAELNSQSKMEALGFTKDKGWVYYTGKAPMLQGKDTSSAGTTFQMSNTTTLDSICQNRENKTLSVTINGETHSKTFKGSDTVGDVANWLNGIDGVTANISNNKFNISGTSQDFRVDGELADVLFGNNKTTTKQTITENTDSNGLIVGGGQKKIDDNTTVGQLLGVTSGKYAITYIDDSGNLQSGKFSSDEKLSEVLKFLNDNGFQASIVNGVFTATKDGKVATNISGTIGEKLKGENGTVTNTSSGYKTGQLDASSSTKATATTKLADLGIASGSIFIKDNNNNTLGTIQIDNSMTIDDTAQLLANYGFTLGITDGKVTIEGNGTNRIADGTSNLVSQMKLNNWIETKDKLKTDSTVAQMGFGKGSTLGLVLDNKTYNLTFDANATLQDIIDTLGTYGVTASVDSDGKFTATASGNLVLTNELGAYLTKNSAEGYVKEADGYKSKDPLEFKGDKVKLDYDSKVGDILGTGKDGVLRLTLNKDTVVDLTYKADDTMADIIADLKGYGITATIDDGVLKATSNEKTFRFSGEIGKIISGDTPQYDDISTGYVSKDLSYETTNKTNMNNTLKEMGVSSGQIHVLSNDGKIVSTLDIDNSYTVAQVKSLLQPFGMTLSVDENGKFTVASAEGYKLSDSTSNMVSKMGLNNWTTATEKLTGATTLAQMGFKDGADLNLFLDGIVMNVLSFDANQTVDDIIFGLAAYGIDASVNADGQFTATSKSHTFIMSGGLGSYLTKGTGGYVNSDTAYESYKPLVESKDYVETASKGLDYNKHMTETSTLESLGFAQGGTVRVMLDGKTPYTLQFLATDKVQDVIYALSAYGINAEVKDGRFVAESVNNTFTLTGNLGSYFVQGGAYQNEITGYESNPLTYETTEKLTNDTKLSDLGITRGDINVIKDGKVTDTIHISDNTTIGQLFSAIKPYGMTGEIVTKANGDTSIRISADSDIKLADGTSNVVSGLGLQEVRKGDFEGTKKYWDDDATSGLITEDTLLSTLDRNGFIAQGSLIFNTGEGDDAVQHIINISANETVGSLLKKFNDSGIKATLDDGVIKLTGGLDKLTFTGGTSGLVETIGLDIHNIDKYASSTSALTYEGETHYSASNFANANTKLDIVNATDGNMSIFVDGIKCNIEVKSSDSFADLFKKIKDKVKARTGLDIQAGFKTKDGSISANPNDADNTGIIGLEIEKGHELVVGASNDTTNFATIANLNKTDYNAVTGSRALYRVNVNSLITESGLYRDGDITEGTFKIGDAEFTIDSTTTLASLINQINKNDKAYANAYWDTLAGTLVIESTVTGASLINIEAGTSNFTDIMGFTKTKDGVSALVTDSQTLGQNAVVRINGTTVTSATNVITSDISKIKGLTINLKNVSAGETVTITVEQDKEAIYSAVSDTLDAYNTMMEALGKELADKSSLGGESILKLMRNNLKRLMTSSLTGAYVFKNLASVGISTGEASDKISTNVTSLLIDKDKFMDALNTDSDAVQDLLVGTKANPGIFLQANNIVESSINTDGYFSNMANTLSKSISNIEKKISKNNLAIENYRTKLETKFHNMELTISGLQSAYANILK